MKNILIIGSGSNSKEWYETNFEKLGVFNEIHAINHACIFMKKPFIQHMSTDFKKNDSIPDEEWNQHKKLIIKKVCGNSIKEPLRLMLQYAEGSMFLEACCHVFNVNKFDCKIYCIGCDFDYSGNNTHFYGKGGKDPLRVGKEKLLVNLEILGKLGVFFNLSDNPNSLLPFEKITLERIKLEKNESVDENIKIEKFKIPPSAQYGAELYQYIGFLKSKNVKSYLEIGVREGGTLYRVAKALPIGSTIVPVDLPNNVWGHKNSEISMMSVINELNRNGYNAHAVIGDSSSSDVINRVKTISEKFDAVLIDGDHRYEGCKKDYLAYKNFCKIISFHDIVGNGCKQGKNIVEVPILWNEIKGEQNSMEFIGDKSLMGIGVLY